MLKFINNIGNQFEVLKLYDKDTVENVQENVHRDNIHQTGC